MHDPFDLSDTVIRDLAHVLVTRHSPRDGRRCEYRKRFKPDGLRDAGYWIQRENEFLADASVVKHLRHVVELSAFSQVSDGQRPPVIESVVTYDAGVTIEDWLRVQPRYRSGETYGHPFKHAGVFLSLIRACLVALREIHQHGIVHCDIKADNICLPHLPYPRQSGQPIRIDFEHIRLIDFAFSITPERPLERALPILPQAPYQSNQLKLALREDGARRGQAKLAAQRLDYRADLYGLGYLAGQIAVGGLLQPGGPTGHAVLDGALNMVERLKAFNHGAPWHIGKALPHDAMILEIDGLLNRLAGLEAYQWFHVAGIAAPDWAAPESARADDGRAHPHATPPTPMAPARPVPAPSSPIKSKSRPWRRKLAWAGSVLGLAGALVVVMGQGEWRRWRAVLDTHGAVTQPGSEIHAGPPPSPPEPEQRPAVLIPKPIEASRPRERICRDYSDQEKNYAGCRFEHVLFDKTSNPEGANFSGAQGLPDWISQGLDGAGAYSRKTLIKALQAGFNNARGANLQGADLRGIRLTGVVFREANLQEADLRGADLREIDWQGADLTWALWSNGKRCLPGSIGVCRY